MYKSVDEYLYALKQALHGSDSATIQDALADAREHLTTALATIRESQPGLNEREALQQAIEQYGTPEETATAYVEVERRTFPGLAPVTVNRQGSPLGRFFGIYTDPRAWGALLFMLIAFVTGVVYFSWAVTGLSLSIAFALFIFGLPVALLFLLSVRGVAWLEGRLVEALLGIRMPRRPLVAPQNAKLVDRIKALVLDKHTWLSLIYMLLQFVLGTAYFVLLVMIFAFCLAGLAIPFMQEIFDLPVIYGNVYYYLPVWSYPLIILAVISVWTITMHMTKLVGGLHGRYAKFLLVTD